MKISVSGKDATDEIGKNLQKIAGMRDGDGAHEGFKRGGEVASLAGSENESQLGGRHLELLRISCYVDNDCFSLRSESMGAVSLFLRKVLWKVMRPVFDWITHRQNNINAQIVHAMELEKQERDRQISALEKAVAQLKCDRR